MRCLYRTDRRRCGSLLFHPAVCCPGKAITTLEGLSQEGHLHPVQQGFIDEQAAQCGYCTNGMIMTLVALFERDPEASEQQIKTN